MFKTDEADFSTPSSSLSVTPTRPSWTLEPCVLLVKNIAYYDQQLASK